MTGNDGGMVEDHPRKGEDASARVQQTLGTVPGRAAGRRRCYVTTGKQG